MRCEVFFKDGIFQPLDWGVGKTSKFSRCTMGRLFVENPSAIIFKRVSNSRVKYLVVLRLVHHIR